MLASGASPKPCKMRVTLTMPHPGCSDGVHSDKQLQPLRQSEWGKKREKEKKGKLKQISKEFCKKKKKKIWLQLKYREGEVRQADDGSAVPQWETNSNELNSQSFTKQGYEFITLHLCRVKRSYETPETCRGNWESTNPHGIVFKIISQLADCTGGKNRD